MVGCHVHHGLPMQSHPHAAGRAFLHTSTVPCAPCNCAAGRYSRDAAKAGLGAASVPGAGGGYEGPYDGDASGGGGGGGPADVYSSYRSSRSGAYHQMILTSVAAGNAGSNAARGGGGGVRRR